MPGKVYCFNAHNEPMSQLTVNGHRVASPPGPWAYSGSNIYTPSSVAIARARHGEGQAGPVFANDMPNWIRIDWDSFVIQATISMGDLPNVSLDDDLIIYFAVNQATLMNTRGFVLLTVRYHPAGPGTQGAEMRDGIANPNVQTE